MQINDIFTIEQYDEAYAFICKNQGTKIVDLGNGQYSIVEIPQPTLDELKALKRAEINQARDKAEQGGFEYMGKIFDSDQVSCIRMSSAAQAMQYADDTATITWTTQDNSTIDLNKSQLM